MYATTESNLIFEIDPNTLDTLKKVDITKEFPGNHGNKANTASISPWNSNIKGGFHGSAHVYESK